jgi:SpoVK/Ycf46/Vps4 family AAA+-type ATPase
LICRIYVDLPDAQNRRKILKILLTKENLESDFKFDKLANATEGYSGSDLKVLCLKLSMTALFFSIAPERFTDIHFHLRVWIHLVTYYLQNLCIAAAYRPVHELLEEEKKVACSCFQMLVLALLSLRMWLI